MLTGPSPKLPTAQTGLARAKALMTPWNHWAAQIDQTYTIAPNPDFMGLDGVDGGVDNVKEYDEEDARGETTRGSALPQCSEHN